MEKAFSFISNGFAIIITVSFHQQMISIISHTNFYHPPQSTIFYQQHQTNIKKTKKLFFISIQNINNKTLYPDLSHNIRLNSHSSYQKILKITKISNCLKQKKITFLRNIQQINTQTSAQTIIIMIQSRLYRTTPSLLNPEGITKIIQIFSSTTLQSSQNYLLLIRQMYEYVEVQIQQKQVKKYKENICKFINTYFLLCLLQQSILIPQCDHSVADRKIIRVIIISYKMLHLQQFIQRSTWRGNNLQSFIDKLKQIKNQKLINALKSQKINKLDLQYLYSTHKIFQKHSCSQSYVSLGDKIKNSSLKQLQIRQLFVNFVQKMYQFIGRIYKQTIRLEIIKLQLLYLNCLLKLPPSSIIKIQPKKSCLPDILQWKGYQKIQHYFNDITSPTILSDKQYCKDLFKAKMDVIPQMSQDQSSVLAG